MDARFSVLPAAHVYLVRGREVLLQCRRDTGYVDGYWVAGAAGHIEPGERASTAAMREVTEELGVRVEEADLRPASVLQRTDGSADPVQQRADWYFTVTRWKGTPRIVEPEKCSALEWYPLDELPRPVPGYEAVVLQGLRDADLSPFTYFGYSVTVLPRLRATDVATVATATKRWLDAAERPITVGVSGFGGSGKSTLARELVVSLSSAIRVRGDDFLDPARSHHRSHDWAGVERKRLASTVLEPFRQGRPSNFQRFDWSTRQLAQPEPVPLGDVLVVDLIGLFHPEAMPALDLTIWCDVDLETATLRGKKRDAELGRRHDRLWDEVWVPNERAFLAGFAPHKQAAILYDHAR